MKKVESLLVALIMLLNVSFGYTLTITYNGNDTVREVEGGESVIVGLSGREDANYVVDGNNAVLKIYGNRRQFVMPEGNVDISITPQGESGSGSEVDILTMQVGDYVEYQPTGSTIDLTALTGITQDSLDPTLTTQWRVLSNDGTTVELVSADSVGNLTLAETSKKGTDGTFSEGSQEIYNIAKNNYANAIYILNEISRGYANDIGDGRGLGYNGTSTEMIDIDQYPLTYAATTGNPDFINGEPYINSYLESDVTTLINNDMLVINDASAMWLAARNWSEEDDNARFFVLGLGNDAGVGSGILFLEGSVGNLYSGTFTRGVRPVVTLKSNIKITGAGTVENPWKIN